MRGRDVILSRLRETAPPSATFPTPSLKAIASSLMMLQTLQPSFTVVDHYHPRRVHAIVSSDCSCSNRYSPGFRRRAAWASILDKHAGIRPVAGLPVIPSS